MTQSDLDVDDAVVREALEVLRESNRRQRGYADHWSFEVDRELAERGVAAALLSSISLEASVVKLISSPNDPPDCLAELSDGSTVGIEVTEVVDPEMAAAHRARVKAQMHGRKPSSRAAGQWSAALWTAPHLVVHLREIVERKDKAWLGEPVGLSLLAAHTDEPTISVAMTIEALAGQTFETSFLDAGYVIFPPGPDPDGTLGDRCPVVRLPIRRAKEVFTEQPETAVPRLSSQEYDRLKASLFAVGPHKPIGYLPLRTIREWLGEEPTQLDEELRRLGLATALLDEQRCCIKNGALYAYDRNALTEILGNASTVLDRHGLSTIADRFVLQIAATWFESDHPVSEVIRQAFGETENRRT